MVGAGNVQRINLMMILVMNKLAAVIERHWQNLSASAAIPDHMHTQVLNVMVLVRAHWLGAVHGAAVVGGSHDVFVFYLDKCRLYHVSRHQVVASPLDPVRAKYTTWGVS